MDNYFQDGCILAVRNIIDLPVGCFLTVVVVINSLTTLQPTISQSQGSRLFPF